MGIALFLVTLLTSINSADGHRRRNFKVQGSRRETNQPRARRHANSESRLSLFRARFRGGVPAGIGTYIPVVPRVGTRMAELMEAPIMLAVTIMG
jgi:hypothetical protein